AALVRRNLARFRAAARAEQHEVGARDRGARRLRQHFARAAVNLEAVFRLLDQNCEPAMLDEPVEHAPRLPDHLGTDAVAGMTAIVAMLVDIIAPTHRPSCNMHCTSLRRRRE